MRNILMMRAKIINFYAVVLFGLTFLSGATARAEDVKDPWESYNRGAFWFNNQLDTYLIEPLSQVYDSVVPDAIQISVGNFVNNLKYPVYLVSDLIQFEFDLAAEHSLRFVLNTTVGVAGLVDVAKEIGFPHQTQDFGLAFASYGCPPGPYLVIPVLGPSTLRDGLGKVFDNILYPTNYLGYTGMNGTDVFAVGGGLKVLDLVNTRADLTETINTAKGASLDYYLFMQKAYVQHRSGVINQRFPSASGEKDILDDDYEE